MYIFIYVHIYIHVYIYMSHYWNYLVIIGNIGLCVGLPSSHKFIWSKVDIILSFIKYNISYISPY